MKNISLRNFLFAVLVPVLSLQALDVKEDTNNKVVVNNDFVMQYNEISGEGKDKSSLSDGVNYFESSL